MTQTAIEPPERGWWGQHLRAYNVRLALATLIVFAVHISILFAKSEITAFTLVYMILSYLLAIGIANVGYFLGSIGERILKTAYLVAYRKIAYNVSLWLFILVVFLSPLIVGSIIVMSGSSVR